ncbi:hypothetical protein GLE_0860 [Lysobacter enzymogenes]|uniref:Uncharacterized protein n=1 Tax=Lysobacter enzymogenes TaxID=69 RepID=A0A0S2DCI6_LYSEN|nr:hypothetical protein GLE_0860 [Lysobacter enzymogenes]
MRGVRGVRSGGGGTGCGYAPRRGVRCDRAATRSNPTCRHSGESRNPCCLAVAVACARPRARCSRLAAPEGVRMDAHARHGAGCPLWRGPAPLSSPSGS